MTDLIQALQEAGEGSAVYDRIMARVEHDLIGGCMLWSGKVVPGGYGAVSVSGRDVLAHRAMWRLHKGEIPQGQIVRHKCDVPACVNPDHLSVGTLSQNTQDMISRGRGVFTGSRFRLPKTAVAEIQQRILDGEKDASIADIFGVARNTIGRRRRKMMEKPLRTKDTA